MPHIPTNCSSARPSVHSRAAPEERTEPWQLLHDAAEPASGPEPLPPGEGCRATGRGMGGSVGVPRPGVRAGRGVPLTGAWANVWGLFCFPVPVLQASGEGDAQGPVQPGRQPPGARQFPRPHQLRQREGQGPGGWGWGLLGAGWTMGNRVPKGSAVLGGVGGCSPHSVSRGAGTGTVLPWGPWPSSKGESGCGGSGGAGWFPGLDFSTLPLVPGCWEGESNSQAGGPAPPGVDTKLCFLVD